MVCTWIGVKTAWKEQIKGDTGDNSMILLLKIDHKEAGINCFDIDIWDKWMPFTKGRENTGKGHVEFWVYLRF